MDDDDRERRGRPTDEKERHRPNKTDREKWHGRQDCPLHRRVGSERLTGQNSVVRWPARADEIRFSARAAYEESVS
jgi:hypothetical protein